jgi:hypothetical protein
MLAKMAGVICRFGCGTRKIELPLMGGEHIGVIFISC